VQETFIRAMSHLALLDILKPHQRRAWLYRTLKNLFLDELNARQRQQNLARQLTWQMPAGDDLEDDSANPFELAPAQYRDLLEKRYVLGLNSQEIAAESGVPAATIRSRLHLALEKLRLQKAKLR
jgi:RNA polymerase sigma-70 factor (ECF subfamily)